MPLIDRLLSMMPQADASDLHVVVGQPPKFRIHGEVVAIAGEEPFTERKLEHLLFEIVEEKERKRYLENRDFDFAHEVPGLARFRVNFFFQRTGYGAVFRIIPEKVKTIEQLGLPKVLIELAALRTGLVLVTGPTGSGKSTTLAAMIDYINTHDRRHIVTIEDPVEFVHKDKMCVICHREVGNHTRDFGAALRAAIRQDADVILVGEMRDLETIGLALSAASTGTLVFGTLHTNNAPKTIDRIIDVFPTDQQAQIRTLLSESLRGVVAQLLLRKKRERGRVAVNEILIGNHAVSNIIREGKIERLVDVLQSGKAEGMRLMDDELAKLAQGELIDGTDAYMNASDKRRFEHYLV